MCAERRTYTKLKKQMSVIEFETFCKRIANQYGKSEGHYSASYFVENENITRRCFYRILEEAIVRNLVTEQTVNYMEAKAISNQRNYGKNAGEATLRHYAQLRKKREEFIISQYSKLEIKKVAEDFAKSLELSKKDFAKKYGISISILDALLKTAFVENIADDQICKKIEKRSLDKDSSKRAMNFFKELWEKRGSYQ